MLTFISRMHALKSKLWIVRSMGDIPVNRVVSPDVTFDTCGDVK